MKWFEIGFALIFIGILLIIIGFFLITFSSIKESKVEIAVGGFIGPIPFGFATSKELLILIIIISLIFFILFVTMFLK